MNPAPHTPGEAGEPPWAARHQAAIDAGEPGYLDSDTGLFVLTAAYLAERGECCESGCRHCPYKEQG